MITCSMVSWDIHKTHLNSPSLPFSSPPVLIYRYFYPKLVESNMWSPGIWRTPRFELMATQFSVVRIRAQMGKKRTQNMDRGSFKDSNEAIMLNLYIP